MMAESGPRAENAIAALSELVRDSEVWAEWGAILALSEMGPLAQSAIPLLVLVRCDRKDVMRQAVAPALTPLGPNGTNWSVA